MTTAQPAITPRSAEMRGTLLTLAAVLVWSANYIVGRTLVGEVPPVLLAF